MPSGQQGRLASRSWNDSGHSDRREGCEDQTHGHRRQLPAPLTLCLLLASVLLLQGAQGQSGHGSTHRTSSLPFSSAEGGGSASYRMHNSMGGRRGLAAPRTLPPSPQPAPLPSSPSPLLSPRSPPSPPPAPWDWTPSPPPPSVLASKPPPAPLPPHDHPHEARSGLSYGVTLAIVAVGTVVVACAAIGAVVYCIWLRNNKAYGGGGGALASVKSGTLRASKSIKRAFGADSFRKGHRPADEFEGILLTPVPTVEVPLPGCRKDAAAARTPELHTPGASPAPGTPLAATPRMAQSMMMPETQSDLPVSPWVFPTALTSQLDHITIRWSAIRLGGVIGEGGQGKVFRGRWQGNKVAVKMLTLDNSNALPTLHRECLVMRDLQHPCIARVYGIVDEPPNHALVMQYYGRGTLTQYMTTPEYYNLQDIHRLRLAIQVASGMCFLHEKKPTPILHGDLKSSNILLTEDANVVLADFGLSMCLDAGAGGSLVSGAHTVSISPPEVLRDPHAPRDAAVDVYAFGIVLLEIMTGRPAYSGLKASEVRLLVIAGNRPLVPSTVPPSVGAIIEACWAQDPGSRPSFADVTNQLFEVLQELYPQGASELSTMLTSVSGQ